MTMYRLLHSDRTGKVKGRSQEIYLIFFALFFNSFLEVSSSSCSVTVGSDDILKPLKPLEERRSDVILLDEKNNKKDEFTVCICSSVNKDSSSVLLKEGNVSFGSYKQSTVSAGTNFIQLAYQVPVTGNGSCSDTGRSSKILFICDTTSDYGTMKVLERYNNTYLCSYTFVVGTRYACTVSDSLSSGSIFCILFFTGVSIYLLLGFLYQRLLVGAKGLEQIPNYSFWRDFGNLQADGCDFICRCGPRQEAQSYRGIDERIPRDDERDDQLLNM